MVFHRCSRPIGTAIFIVLLLTATVLSGAKAAATEQHGTKQDGHEETTQDAFSIAHGEETPYVRGSRHGNVAGLDPSQPTNGKFGGTTQGERVLKQTNDLTSVPGSIIVKYKKGLPEANRANIRNEVSAIQSKKLSKLANDWEVIKVKENTDLKKLIRKLQKKTSEIEYAELDYWLTTVVDANDPKYADGSLWGMYGSNTSPNTNQYGCQAGSAWAKGFKGSSDVVIGIIDEGIDVGHPDLQGNIWFNPNETAGNGLDDDENGKVDDVNGWDFFYDDATVFDVDDGDDHGTHVAGTIGATGNNGVGVAGVNWNVNMISAKFLSPYGGSLSDAIDAIDYLTDLKVNHSVNIVASNNSWGGGGFSQAMLDAIRRGGDAGILFITSAGNTASDNDSTEQYPANYDCSKLEDGNARGWDCVVSVASITSTGALSGFSNYGAQTVDLGAPGNDILSTAPGGAYDSKNGTSMATPHVSGAVALCAAANPSLTAQDIRYFLMASTEHTTSLETKTVSEGRLNVDAMMALCLCTVDDDCDDQNACTMNSCDAEVCHFNPIPRCCGDGVCESGENSNKCPADCCGTANDCPVAPPCLTATCDSGVCGTESGTCPSSINESNLSGDKGTKHRYQLEAPDGATFIDFQMSGGSGDADLYVKFGSAPTLTSYDCSPFKSDNDEQCTDNKPGMYHVMVHGFSSFSGVSLQGSHNGNPPCTPENEIPPTDCSECCNGRGCRGNGKCR